MIDIIMGYECNVECDYCTITREMRTRNMTTASVASALEEGARAGMKEAAFGGGEPTIRKDLVKLVSLAKNLGYATIKISSNGLMYAYPEYVDKLLEAGATQFNIPLMGHTAAAYRTIMGQERHLDLVRKGVVHLVSRSALVVGDVIMKNDTYRHLEGTVEYWAELGVEHFVFWLVSLTDRNAANRESLVTVTEMRPWMVAAFDGARRRGIKVYSRHIPRCMLPGYHDHVWDVRKERIYVVTPESRFWLSESRITANTFVGKCDGCAIRQRCMGIRQDYLDTMGDGEVAPLSPADAAAMADVEGAGL
jgi:cyclic pyranopterin phosphate synthase